MSKPSLRLKGVSLWALACLALTSQAQEPVPADAPVALPAETSAQDSNPDAEAAAPAAAEPTPEVLDTIPVASTEPEDEPAEAPEARRGFGVDEIIVTAQKREEAASTVPIAITAYSGEDMATLGVTDTRDLRNLVPGFSAADSGYNTPIYTLRGSASTIRPTRRHQPWVCISTRSTCRTRSCRRARTWICSESRS